MEQVLAVFMVFMVGVVAFTATRRGFTSDEQTFIGVAFALHIVFALLQVWMNYEVFAGADLEAYRMSGVMLSSLLRDDFLKFFPEVIKLVFQQAHQLPVEIRGDGTSTGSMNGLTGLLMFFLADSIYACGLFIAVLSYLGKLAIYRCFRSYFPVHLHRRLLLATLLMPSVVYWSAGLIKEAFAIIGVGLIVSGLIKRERSPLFGRIVLIGFGLVVLGLIKPYVLFPIAAASGAWMYCDRAVRAGQTVIVKPAYFMLGTAVAIGGIVLLGKLFPQYAFDKLGEALAREQGFAETVEGGSNYSVGDANQTSIMAQLAFAPLGLISALFRPFLFEVKNVSMALSAVEAAVLTVLFVRAITVQTWAGIKRELARSPLLVFCLVFSVVLGVAVGLASSNLGSLSRYRVPLIPFFAFLVLALNVRAPQPARNLALAQRVQA